ncbi:MAG TPA: glycosyltransferase [Candidatus Ozemobacteraceae bacterium]|nr:glycosyltransferase [Candidatus Ozemobacteraceae bacterium]
MKVIQVVPGIGDEAAGPSYSVPMLCQALHDNGAEVDVHVLCSSPSTTRSYQVRLYRHHTFPFRGLGRSPEMLAGLRLACQSADIIQTNSLWMMPNIYPAWAKKGTTCKLVIAPRGTLAAWSLKRSWLKKKLIGWCGQYAALRAADMFYATCQKEYEEIRACGYRQPVAIVPIGMDIPAVEHKASPGLRHILFFGRLHEVKAVDHLILAWKQVADKFPDWDLQIAGPDAGDKPRLERIVREADVPRARFLGEFSGHDKYKLLASADLYVLPSKTENFAVTVAEALASGTPVIASSGTPWNGLDAHMCGWWGFKDEASLAAVLNRALSLDRPTLETMGRNGIQWIQDDFNWSAIGRQTLAAYEWLLHGGSTPSCVISE